MITRIFFLLLITLLMFFSACSDDLNETNSDQQPVDESKTETISASDYKQLEQQADFQRYKDPQSSASQSYKDRNSQLFKEIFVIGGDESTPLADYLFIIDNSVSMRGIIGRVVQGFLAIDPTLFPEYAKIGIMNTQLADLDDLNKIHISANNRPPIDYRDILLLEPGFLRLVDKAGIQAFVDKRVNLGSEYQYLNFKKPGCPNGWFSPSETNEQGDLCFAAHAQVSLHGSCEAGLTVLKQMIAKQGEKNLFRPGAFVNIIYVSDTHDPGCSDFEDIVNAPQPDYQQLQQLIKQHNSISGLKFHGIVPESLCSIEKELHNLSYLPVIQESGGVYLDICQHDDYSPIVEQIAKASVLKQAIVKLSNPVSELLYVAIQDQQTNDFLFDGQSIITLPNALSNRQVTVTVAYYGQEKVDSQAVFLDEEDENEEIAPSKYDNQTSSESDQQTAVASDKYSP